MRRLLSGSVVFSWALLLALPALGGTYLPDAGDLPKAVDEIDPDTSSDHIIREYVGALQSTTIDVFCPGTNVKVGTLDFEFAGYKGRRATDPAGANTIGGAAIRGGFKLDPGFMLMDGYKLRWLQTYIDTGPETVDGSPFYPEFGIAGIDADLYDVPFDLLTTDITVSFESALVCVDCADQNQVKYLGSFLWSYTIASGVVTASGPSNWGPPTQSFLDTIDANTSLMLEEGCCIKKAPSLSSQGATVLVLVLLTLGTLASGRILEPTRCRASRWS